MTVVDILTRRLEKSLEGWARMSTEGAWHFFRRSRYGSSRGDERTYYLEACSHCSLLPIHGAKLRKRDELPEGAIVCKDCESRGR